MLVLLACAHTPSSPPGAGQPEGAAGATAPTPYTAEDLAAALPTGSVLRLEARWPGEPPVTHHWEFRDATPEGVVIVSWVFDEAGSSVGDERVATETWASLRDHAAFPAAATTIRPERLETPLGVLDTHLYTVLGPEPTRTRRYWFADELPGPPVLHTDEVGGAETFRQTVIERRPAP